MNINCPHIEEVVNISKSSGNDILEVSEGWSKVKQVVHMKEKFKSDDKSQVQAKQSALRYWSTERTPHNAAEEGFTCDECSVGITFPK